MAEEPHAPVRSATLMVGARLVNLAVGLLSIPVLIRFLGGPGFAAWAILLALSAGFSLLEIGMSPTMVRFLALPARDENWQLGRRVLGQMWLLLGMTFGAGLVVVSFVSAPLAGWLGLQPMGTLSAAGAIEFVFCAVAARAFLQSGTLALFAARRFASASAIALLQPLCSNVAAMIVAWQTGRLDLALMAFWLVQLTVLGMTCFFTRRMCTPAFGARVADVPPLRQLAWYGVTNQLDGWAQFVNFQFDKFIVAGFIGLWAVAPYEVANRAVAALRSIPASGAETFLPTAMSQQADPAKAWQWYEASTRIAAYGVFVFMLAPLAVAPVFLYAWTGEMGYIGRWAFVALSVGAMASVLAIPAATLAQAAGHPQLQARAAALAILVNIPLSLFLVSRWGLVGASIGSGVAMVAGAVALTHAVHRLMKRPVIGTLRSLARFWPLLAVCAAWGAVTYLVFGAWIEGLEPATRYSRALRVYPGLLAGVVYVSCVASLLMVELRRNALTLEERTSALRLLRLDGWARLRPRR